MSDTSDADGDLIATAGEYVIGTLSADERTSFAARLPRDQQARHAVAVWEQRLACLAGYVDDVVPSPAVWPRIEQALDPQAQAPTRFRVIPGGGRSAADYLASRNRWRMTALATGAVAAILLVFVGVREGGVWPASDTHGIYVAAVNRGGDQPALIIRVDLATRRVLVRPVAAEAPKGRSLELWYIADGGAPRSMGLVKAAPASLTMPADLKASGAAKFAVSVEPEGGSKTGGPTGPVVYAGALIPEE